MKELDTLTDTPTLAARRAKQSASLRYLTLAMGSALFKSRLHSSAVIEPRAEVRCSIMKKNLKILIKNKTYSLNLDNISFFFNKKA